MDNSRIMSHHEYLIKYNVQRLMEQNRSDSDYGYIAKVLDIDINETKDIINNFSLNVQKIATEIKNSVQIPINMEQKFNIAFIGDSLTSERESYFNVIKELLSDFSKITFVDASLSGAKISDVYDSIFLKVIDKEVDIAHVLIGTNDIRRQRGLYSKNNIGIIEYKKHLENILMMLNEAGIKTIVSTIPPVDNDAIEIVFGGRNWEYRDEDVIKYNIAIRSITKKCESILNDCWTSAKSKEEIIFYDGIHINDMGTKILVKSLLKYLIQIMD
ncbi:MAG: SGNH/GDSL hydrolase family protein [Christensenellaceae bacterium]